MLPLLFLEIFMEVKNMTMTLACKDAGMKECPYVARGQNMEELMNDMGKHAKTIHGYTDEQLNDPEMITTLKKVVKTE
jgi:predicted small metal-binding protein